MRQPLGKARESREPTHRPLVGPSLNNNPLRQNLAKGAAAYGFLIHILYSLKVKIAGRDGRRRRAARLFRLRRIAFLATSTLFAAWAIVAAFATFATRTARRTLFPALGFGLEYAMREAELAGLIVDLQKFYRRVISLV